MGASAVVTFTLVVQVAGSAADGTVIANTATVGADNDSNPANDSTTARTTVYRPLAVTVTRLTAKRRRNGVLVRWRTGTEVDALGFRVYRARGPRRARLNRRLLPAAGRVSGGSYSYLDRRAPRHHALRYGPRTLDAHGRLTWHGPVRVPAV